MYALILLNILLSLCSHALENPKASDVTPKETDKEKKDSDKKDLDKKDSDKKEEKPEKKEETDDKKDVLDNLGKKESSTKSNLVTIPTADYRRLLTNAVDQIYTDTIGLRGPLPRTLFPRETIAV